MSVPPSDYKGDSEPVTTPGTRTAPEDSKASRERRREAKRRKEREKESREGAKVEVSWLPLACWRSEWSGTGSSSGFLCSPWPPSSPPPPPSPPPPAPRRRRRPRRRSWRWWLGSAVSSWPSCRPASWLSGPPASPWREAGVAARAGGGEGGIRGARVTAFLPSLTYRSFSLWPTSSSSSEIERGGEITWIESSRILISRW